MPRQKVAAASTRLTVPLVAEWTAGEEFVARTARQGEELVARTTRQGEFHDLFIALYFRDAALG